MSYAKMDYERIANSKPINGTAANMMRKPETISEFEEIREEYKNLGLAIGSVNNKLAKINKYSHNYAETNAKRQELLAKRAQMKKDYFYVVTNNRDRQNYIVEEMKKRMSESDFKACIRQADKTMLYELRFGEQA